MKYWRFYTCEILRGFWLTLPITTIYYLLFFSYSQIGLFESVLAATIFLTEIPTGLLSDRFGHKQMSSIGFLFYGIAMLVLGLYPYKISFLIGFIIWGLAESMISGAYTSLLYEHIKFEKGNYTHIKMRATIFRGISVVIASLIGAFLYNLRPGYPFIIYGFVLFLLAAILITTPYKQTIKKEITISKIINKAIWGLKKRRVLWIISFSIFMFIIFQTFSLLIMRPLFVQQGFNVDSLGWIMALIFGITWSLPFLLRKQHPSYWMLIIVALILTLMLVLLPFIRYWIFLMVILIIRGMKEVFEIITEILLHKSISSVARASVFSVQSSLMNISSSIGLLLMGYLINITNLDFGVIILVIAGILIVLGHFLFFNLFKGKNIFSYCFSPFKRRTS